MKMKILIIPVMLLCVQVMAQQRPHYTQYILNNYILNPALSGIENYTDVKISTRDQWVGLNGAPKTSYFSIQAPIGKGDYRTSSTSFEVPGQNPRGKYYWENYTAAEPHHGIGLTMINDRTGSFNRLTINATYAYHLGLSPTTNLAGGFSAGITNVSLDRSKHDFSGSGDPFDPATSVAINNEINKIRYSFQKSFNILLFFSLAISAISFFLSEFISVSIFNNASLSPFLKILSLIDSGTPKNVTRPC